MTLKTLKSKENNSLILDDEFLQYCKLNNIEDVQKLAKETFKKGFDILKYGDLPTVVLTPSYRPDHIHAGVYVQPMTTKIEYTDKGELTIKEPKKVEKNDLYDE